MTKTALSISSLLLGVVFLSCSGSKETSNVQDLPDNVVGIVGEVFVTYDELRDNFISGSIEKNYSQEGLVEFLPIYLDFRGKLLDARAIGYYDDERIKNEYELYSKQASYAYWMDREIRPTKFAEFKNRFDYLVKSRHVLIAVDQSASSEDTLAAYNKIMEAREEFLAGASMQELDARFSSVRDGRSMGGDLPWFRVGNTVPEFEDALYSLEVNDISMPVRTQFGYHLIFIEDKRERLPSRELSHIFVRANSDSTKIEDAYASLSTGTSWNEVVTQFTEDTPSIRNNGYIGWINYGDRYDGAFIDSVYSIDPGLEYSTPVKSVYGYHIFKIDSVQAFENEEARDAFIMTQLEESNSFQENNGFVVDYLLDRFGAISYDRNVDKFSEYIATLDTLSFVDIELPDNLLTLLSLEFDEYRFTLTEYLIHIILNYPLETNMQYSPRWFEAFKQAKVDENLTALTLKTFPEFDQQVKSYQDGLVVYQINEDSVWSTATVDTSILFQNYEMNLDDYQYNERYHYYMITSSRDTSLDRAIEFIENGNSPDSVLSNGFLVGVISDSTGVFQGEPFTLLSDMKIGEISERFEYSNRKGHFLLVDIIPPRAMTFEESFNRLASEYQPIREEKWLERIRKTYNIRSFPEVLVTQYQAEQNSQ